ncbi:hypothetical protein BCY89_15080 [Sphingobacterium siyangense]|jgi:hypothetical protein|uniref:Uncharacterized protein n=1 Tax=Sphingobacterium siyangense TaxID=459529 RepID=A0A420FHV1_9SPHI|nr:MULTISPECIES: hypothetical protein [Sphingobacterium]QQT30889.1 hypothetical protein I6I99_27035 [Sphingobacterium multivorum]RKF32495.1 hypothetical protein BCY89_15080 [Sphingobacterium siyangense]
MKFEKFLKTLNKEFEAILSEKKPLESFQLNSDLSVVKGRNFYNAVKLLSNDFDKDCENALSEIASTAHKKYLAKQKGKVKNNKTLNTYQKFITQFVSSQAEVSEKAGIENTRFTKVLNQTADDFYAHEVFSIAKSQNMKLIDAFEQLYE